MLTPYCWPCCILTYSLLIDYHCRNFILDADSVIESLAQWRNWQAPPQTSFYIQQRGLKQRGLEYVSTWETDGAMEGTPWPLSHQLRPIHKAWDLRWRSISKHQRSLFHEEMCRTQKTCSVVPRPKGPTVTQLDRNKELPNSGETAEAGHREVCRDYKRLLCNWGPQARDF